LQPSRPPCSAPAARRPAALPADYSKIVDAAKKEGKLVVYATTDAAPPAPCSRLPVALSGVQVEYRPQLDRALQPLHRRGGGRQRHRDLLWSSAMDLQVKLVADARR